MHIYVCPYCDPCEKAYLTEIKIEEISCKHGREEVCAEKHKCKEVMTCKKCKHQWTYSLKFLRDQKRKIKDG